MIINDPESEQGNEVIDHRKLILIKKLVDLGFAKVCNQYYGTDTVTKAINNDVHN